jgi:hypothetical protein
MMRYKARLSHNGLRNEGYFLPSSVQGFRRYGASRPMLHALAPSRM